MATNKKSFILYCDQRGTFNRLSDEQAGKLIKHIFSYVSDENPEADFVTELAFEGIKSALKRDLKKFEQIKEKRVEAGRKGGKQTQANQANASDAKQTQANQADNVNANVSVNDNVNEIYPKKDKQISPAPLFFQNEDLNQWFSLWLNVCKEKGKPHGQSSIEALQMKLSSMPIEKAIAVVKQSASENWVTLHPLKNQIEKEETEAETHAREIMQSIKADNLRRTLYGPKADEFEPQPNLKRIN